MGLFWSNACHTKSHGPVGNEPRGLFPVVRGVPVQALGPSKHEYICQISAGEEPCPLQRFPFPALNGAVAFLGRRSRHGSADTGPRREMSSPRRHQKHDCDAGILTTKVACVPKLDLLVGWKNIVIAAQAGLANVERQRALGSPLLARF